jgi:signal transduction histidine kinase/Tfp pilus assembly protein PilF
MKAFYLLFLTSFQLMFSANVDSLKQEIPKLDGKNKLKAIDETVRYYDDFNLDSTKKYNDILIEESKNAKNKKFLAKGYGTASYYYVTTGLNYKANAYADSAIEYYSIIGDIEFTAFIYNLKGRIYHSLAQTDSSYNNFSKALELLNLDSLEIYLDKYDKNNQQIIDSLEKNNEKIKKRLSVITIVMTDFGLFYLDINKYDDAKELFKKIITIAEKMNDERRLAGTYSNLGMMNHNMDSTDKAIEYYNKALDYADKSNAMNYKMNILSNIANIYSNSYKSEDIEKSIELYNVASGIANEIRDFPSYISFKLNYAKALSQLNKSNKALMVVDSLKSELEKIEDIKLWGRYYNTLSRINYNMNNFKNAYDYELQASRYFDSLRNENNIEHINRMQVAFDTERKDYQIELLQNEKELLQSEKELLNVRMYFVVGLVVFVLILASVLYSRYRIKHKAYEKIDKMNNRLVESEKELKELNATKDKFFSIIAHDLKGPIGTYNNILEFLDNDIDKLSKDEIKEFIFDMKESSARLFSMLEDLLSWARSQTGKIGFNPQRNNIKDILTNNISILSLSAENKNISIHSLLNDDIYFHFDATMITTVVRNLLSNAIKFTQKGGEIKLNAQENNEEIIVSVKDNGVGISQDNIDKLFGIASHFTSKGTNNEKGTGLGLILCKEFIDKHGGKIWVESEEGKGSEFFFSIPKNISN